jgi:hypothetical protein
MGYLLDAGQSILKGLCKIEVLYIYRHDGLVEKGGIVVYAAYRASNHGA